MLVAISASEPVDTAARELRVGGELVVAQDLQRSPLLREIAQLDGQTELAVSEEGFRLWQRYYSCCPSCPDGLASLLQVASFLGDDACAADAAHRLASAVRATLRTPKALPAYFPALDPPPHTPALTHPSLVALSQLPPDTAAAVLRALHPFELCRLQEPFLTAALHATASTPWDLRSPPGAPRPHWETHCQAALGALCDRPAAPVPPLCLSHLGRPTAAYLRNLAPRIVFLLISQTLQPPVLTFLPGATTLTHLSITSSHAPRASLLDSLLALPNLQTLNLHLEGLSAADHATLAATARFSPAAVAHTPALQPLCRALAAVTHASLSQHAQHVRAGACWPPLLSCLFDFSMLRAFACYPPHLPQHHPLLTGPAPLRLSDLSLPSAPLEAPPGAISTPQREERTANAEALAAAAAACAPRWAPLTRLHLSTPHTPDAVGTLLPLLPQLQHLELSGVRAQHIAAAQHALPHLPHLNSIALRPADAWQAEAALSSMLSALQPLPITRLQIAAAPPSPRCAAQLAGLSGLAELHWRDLAVDRDRADPFELHAVTALARCTALTALWYGPLRHSPAKVMYALCHLPHLQSLRLDISGDETWDAGNFEQPLALRALRDLQLLCGNENVLPMVGAQIIQLQALEQLQAPALTSLQLATQGCPNEGASMVGVRFLHALAAALRRLPQLQVLQVPQGLDESAADAAAMLGPALAQLTRLDRLGVVSANERNLRALAPYLVGLPLRHGIE
eukprot:jgi/Ulvmu1/7404/UM036_0064.1